MLLGLFSIEVVWMLLRQLVWPAKLSRSTRTCGTWREKTANSNSQNVDDDSVDGALQSQGRPCLAVGELPEIPGSLDGSLVAEACAVPGLCGLQGGPGPDFLRRRALVLPFEVTLL